MEELAPGASSPCGHAPPLDSIGDDCPLLIDLAPVSFLVLETAGDLGLVFQEMVRVRRDGMNDCKERIGGERGI